MSKFIEVTSPDGVPLVVSTNNIISVSAGHPHYGVEYSGDKTFKYVPRSCITVLRGTEVVDDWYVLEDYDELKEMLM